MGFFFGRLWCRFQRLFLGVARFRHGRAIRVVSAPDLPLEMRPRHQVGGREPVLSVFHHEGIAEPHDGWNTEQGKGYIGHVDASRVDVPAIYKCVPGIVHTGFVQRVD